MARPAPLLGDNEGDDESESEGEPDDDGGSDAMDVADDEDDGAITIDLHRLVDTVLGITSTIQDWSVHFNGKVDENHVFLLYRGPGCLVNPSHTHEPWYSSIVFNWRINSLSLYCTDKTHESIPVPGYIMPAKKFYDRDEDKWVKFKARIGIMYHLYERSAKEMTTPVKEDHQQCFNRALGLPETTLIWRASFDAFHHAIVTDNGDMPTVRLSIPAEGYDFDTGRIKRGLIEVVGDNGKTTLVEAPSNSISAHDGLVTASSGGRLPVGVGRMLLSLFELNFYTRPIAIGGSDVARVMMYINKTLEASAIYKDARNIFYAPRAGRTCILERIASCSQEMVEYFLNKAPQDIQDAHRAIPNLQQIWKGVDCRCALYKQPALRPCWVFKNGIWNYPMSPDIDIDGMKALFIQWEDLTEGCESFLPIKEFDYDFDPECLTPQPGAPSSTPHIDAVLGHQLDGTALQLFVFFMGRLTLQPYWSELGIFDKLQCFPYISGEAATAKSTFLQSLITVAFRNPRIIGDGRAGGGTIGGKSHLMGADFIYNEELNDDPRHKLWNKLTPAFFKNLARMEKVEIDALYKENEDVILRAGLCLLSNHKYMGVERIISNESFSALKSVERSFVTFHFPNEVPADKLDSTLGSKLVKEMPVFLAKAQWQYISLRRDKDVIPELMWFHPYVAAQMQQRLRELHPICKFLDWCQQRQEESKDSVGIICSNAPKMHVKVEDFKRLFKTWARFSIKEVKNPADEKGAFKLFGFTVLTDEQTFLCLECADDETGYKLGPCKHTDNSKKIHARRGWIINAAANKGDPEIHP